MRDRRRKLIAAGVLLVVLLGAGVVTARQLGARPPPVTPVVSVPETPPVTPTPPDPPVKADTDRLLVLSVEGTVQRRGADDSWADLKTGEELRADEAIRTEQSGKAVLGYGEGGRVEISPRSEFTVREISSTVAKVRLEQGRMSAALPKGGGKLRVETRGSEAAAESEGGEFVVLSNGRGQMAVASTQGNVRFSVGASEVTIHEGEQSYAVGGAIPSAPKAIPTSLFLKVAKPSAKVQREQQTTVSGRTAPGAVVSINGLKIASDEDGQFKAAVPLRDGRNLVVVEAEDVAGKRKRVALPPITVKSRIKDVKAHLTWTAPGGEGP